jgi:CDP-diacylglycerol--glycerol-3-phosphate 3-phosphatidyltransferase
VTPVIAALIYQDGLLERWLAFFVFSAAAISDVVDGRMARDKGEITRFGQLLDPIADKLLVLVTFIPLYGIGLLPMWLVLLVLGREVVITVFRRVALSRGEVIVASGWGKSKALVQNWFVGALLVLRINLGYRPDGTGGRWFEHWQGYTWEVVGVSFWFVVVLTVLSLLDYLVKHRDVLSDARA